MDVVDGNLLILASAGSGKTYQLGNRVIGKVAQGVEPETIVALTFTRKAAGEFADSVLGKLAGAVLDPAVAEALARDARMPGADGGHSVDFEPVMCRIVRALPKFTLTTIDSFFTRIVRGFQHELGITGGRFDLIQGPRAEAARDALLGDILGRALDSDAADGFTMAFRRAMAGREDAKVVVALRRFVDEWHREYRRDPECGWGPDFLASNLDGGWRNQLPAMADTARDACDAIDETRKGQVAALHKLIGKLESHDIGAGKLNATGKLEEAVLEALADGVMEDVEVSFHKTFTIPAEAMRAIGDIVDMLARAEMNAAVARTRGVREVVEWFDARAESKLRRRGLLGFDDVKRLMGEWSRHEDARLRREMVDFRLDARFHHWLLDEFQDTSREEWTGLVPLLDEAVALDGGGLFIVGDRKQAIYGWRGGDVSLFDEVNRRFGRGIRNVPMAESWRSAPEILALVNHVCGDQRLITEMFGIGPDRWVWDIHESAPPLRGPERAGEACVEMLAPDDDDAGGHDGGDDDEDAAGGDCANDPRVRRMIERMRELGIGEKPLTCGVLVRSNKDGRMIADALRAAGFEVVQDGSRAPAKEHPAGVAIWQLLRWLANPDDGYARGVVSMSPLAGCLRPSHETPWHDAWERASREIPNAGFAGFVERLVAPLMATTSDYGKKRIAEVVHALAAFDAAPESGARAAADWLERCEVAESPGAAAVQVMTIHKSKGLGFDVVFLPMVPDRRLPEANRFKVARGDGWLCATPPAWVRARFPEMRDAQQQWEAAERYEALCQLYVALTRAKRGLYIYLIKKSRNPTTDAPTHTNWILRAIGADCSPGIKFRAGDPAWAAMIAPGGRQRAGETAAVPLARAVPRRKRRKPSGDEPPAASEVAAPATGHGHGNAAGMRFGSEVHALFERIHWIEDFDVSSLPQSTAGQAVAESLAGTSVAEVFTNPGGTVDVLREQPVDAITNDGAWITGIIDRMHIHRASPGGPPSRIEVIDFKTDAVETPALLVDRHRPQMRAYGDAVRRLFPDVPVSLVLVSTNLRQAIPVAD